MANASNRAKVTDVEPVASATPAVTEPEKPVVVKEIDPHQYVTVRNGFQGMLIYKSKRTGEKFIWSEFGEEQEMELRELKDAKNSSKKMFINNYFMFDEDWIIDYLGVRNYYQNGLHIEDFDNLFKKSPAEIKRIVSKMPSGQKNSISYRAKQLILNGEIDSRKTIAALEDALGIELIEQ